MESPHKALIIIKTSSASTVQLPVVMKRIPRGETSIRSSCPIRAPYWLCATKFTNLRQACWCAGWAFKLSQIAESMSGASLNSSDGI